MEENGPSSVGSGGRGGRDCLEIRDSHSVAGGATGTESKIKVFSAGRSKTCTTSRSSLKKTLK